MAEETKVGIPVPVKSEEPQDIQEIGNWFAFPLTRSEVYMVFFGQLSTIALNARNFSGEMEQMAAEIIQTNDVEHANNFALDYLNVSAHYAVLWKSILASAQYPGRPQPVESLSEREALEFSIALEFSDKIMQGVSMISSSIDLCSDVASRYIGEIDKQQGQMSPLGTSGLLTFSAGNLRSLAIQVEVVTDTIKEYCLTQRNIEHAESNGPETQQADPTLPDSDGEDSPGKDQPGEDVG